MAQSLIHLIYHFCWFYVWDILKALEMTLKIQVEFQVTVTCYLLLPVFFMAQQSNSLLYLLTLLLLPSMLAKQTPSQYHCCLFALEILLRTDNSHVWFAQVIPELTCLDKLSFCRVIAFGLYPRQASEAEQKLRLASPTNLFL